MKRIIIILISLLSVSASLCTAFAQNKVTANSGTEIPAKVSQWINRELAKATRKTLMNFKAGEFFAKDTARLIGYIKGYSPQAGFSTGIIYADNVITNENHPVVVQIHEDGRFEAAIPMNFPVYSAVFFDDDRIGFNRINFYIQPGQTLAMLLDLENLQKNVRFQGTTANINNELSAFYAQLPDLPDRKIYDERNGKTPEEFKPFLDSCLSDYSRAYQKLLETEKLSTLSKNILRNDYQMVYANYLFGYEMDYTREKQMPLEFYGFLQDIPMNNKELLSLKNFGTFINRLEYCQPLSIDRFICWDNKTITSKSDVDSEEKTEIIQDTIVFVFDPHITREKKLEVWNDKQDFENLKKKYADFIKKIPPKEIEIERWRLRDSIYTNVLKLKPGIVYDVTKIRSLDFTFSKDLKNNKAAAWNVLTALTSNIPESLLQSEADRFKVNKDWIREFVNIPRSSLRSEAGRLFLKNFPEEQRGAYELPDTYEAKIFKDLIVPFKGKFLIVDFWGTSCAPCVSYIRHSKTQREQYKNSPDIDFVFITSEDESPLVPYNNFVKEQELTNTYRINADQQRYLHQLFRFTGIPRYILVDREGKILDDNIISFTSNGFNLEELIKK